MKILLIILSLFLCSCQQHNFAPMRYKDDPDAYHKAIERLYDAYVQKQNYDRFVLIK